MERVYLLLVLPVPALAVLLDYYGASVSFSPRVLNPDSFSVEFRAGYIGDHTEEDCEGFSLRCERDQCGTRLDVHRSSHVVGGVCQVLFVQTQTVPNTMDLFTMNAHWNYTEPSWPLPSVNSVVNVSFSVVVDLRTRSDTGASNSSPLSSVLPVIRVPWNCPSDLDLLGLDPDSDLVQCRFADDTIDPRECHQCTPPSVLSLHQSCRLSFSSSSSSSVGLYVVQMVLEDFPRTDIVLTRTDGTQEERRTTQGLSKTPVQFVLSVEEEVPSCLPGLYVPMFEAPTPAPGAWINVTVTQTLNLHIQTRAHLSTLWALWFSGPAGMIQTQTQTHDRSEGQYLLSWRPSAADAGRPVPVCFMVLADLSGVRLSSEFRCVVVNVAEVPLSAFFISLDLFTNINTTIQTAVIKRNDFTTPTTPTPTTTTTATINTTTATMTDSTTEVFPQDNILLVLNMRLLAAAPLSEDDVETVLKQFKEILVEEGIPSSVVLRLLEYSTAPPAGST